MKFYFHPEAENDFFEAINYYEEFRFGLGFDFSFDYQNLNFIKALCQGLYPSILAYSGWINLFHYDSFSLLQWVAAKKVPDF